MREKEDYRDNLERLDRHFPGQELITPTEVAQFLGLTDDSVRDNLPVIKVGGRYFISKVRLAKFLSA